MPLADAPVDETKVHRVNPDKDDANKQNDPSSQCLLALPSFTSHHH